MKILIAEDERITRRNLERQLQKWGYEVVTAENGAIARDILEEQDIPLIITDWEMPEMNGLELVRHIRESDTDHYSYVIVLTGKSDMSDIVMGMEAGADDFLSKPFDKNELRVRLRAGRRVIELERDLERRNQEISVANTRMKNDLDAAAHLQKSLLPSSLPDVAGVDLSWAFHPCDELGGDILDVCRLDEDRIALYLVDVSGHGVPAALLSVSISHMLNFGGDQTSPIVPDNDNFTAAKVASNLNRQFQMDKMDQRYFTLSYAILNLKTLELNYISAGHPPIIRIPENGEPQLLPGRNFAIGWFPNADFTDEAVQLQSNDRIYLYSDGIPEAMNAKSEQYGEKRMRDFLLEQRNQGLDDSVTALTDEIRTWNGSDQFRDDISILAIEIA